jgi:hypothetical protein
VSAAVSDIGNSDGSNSNVGIGIQTRDLPPVTLNRSGTEGFIYQVPEDAFRHSQPGTQLNYEASAENGGTLPNWLRFDSAKLQIVGTKPQDSTGNIDVRITARDAYGNEASTVAKITFEK